MEDDPSTAPPDSYTHETHDGDHHRPHKSKPSNPLRLKTPSTNSASSNPPKHHRPHRRHHHRHHHHKSSSTSSSKQPSAPTDPFAPEQRSLSPETAFRESLFDALADDEGAAFWEGVYGQPVHIYPRPSSFATGPGTGTGTGTGTSADETLETMTDDEYAAYVRSKMYERSHEYIYGERTRIAEERRREYEEQQEQVRQRRLRDRLARQESHGSNITTKRTRRDEEKWRKTWHRYTTSWSTSPSTSTSTSNQNQNQNPITKIPAWPTRTLTLPPQPPPDAAKATTTTDYHKTLENSIRQFYTSILPLISSPSSSTADQLALLKKERVRWHPDKIAQRFFLAASASASTPIPTFTSTTSTSTQTQPQDPTNANTSTNKTTTSKTLGLNEEESQSLLKTVTAVFQIIDRLYTEKIKPSQSHGHGHG